MKAMIFAAGLGTRLFPLTANRPKALVKLGNQTLLERTIDFLKSAGIQTIIINVHHFGEQIIDFAKRYNNLNIQISDEREQLLDTGGALLKAKDLLQGTEPILLINVDILTNINLDQLIEWHKTQEALATLVVRQRQTSRYLLFNQANQLCGWTNKTTGAIKKSRPHEIENAVPAAFSGIHIIQPHLLDLITESGKFSVIDLYLRLSQNYTIKGFNDQSSIWMDLGKPEQLKQAELLLKIDKD